MSYPAQNTDTEFQALVDEIKSLHYLLSCYTASEPLEESEKRLRKSLGNRTYERLFYGSLYVY